MENKHLTLDERNLIELELGRNTSFREIAKYIGKDPTTISKEIKKHRIRLEGRAVHIDFNHCAKNIIVPRKRFVILLVIKIAKVVHIVMKFALIVKKVFVSNLNGLLLFVMDVLKNILANLQSFIFFQVLQDYSF